MTRSRLTWVVSLLVLVLVGCQGTSWTSFLLQPSPASTPTPTAGPTPTATPTADPLLARLKSYGEPEGCRWVPTGGRWKRYVLACTLQALENMGVDPTYLKSFGVRDSDWVAVLGYDVKFREVMFFAIGHEPPPEYMEADGLPGPGNEYWQWLFFVPRPLADVVANFIYDGRLAEIRTYPNGLRTLAIVAPPQPDEPAVILWKTERGYRLRVIGQWTTRPLYLSGTMTDHITYTDFYLELWGLSPEALAAFFVYPVINVVSQSEWGTEARDVRVERAHLLCAFPEGVYQPRPLPDPLEMAFWFHYAGRGLPIGYGFGGLGNGLGSTNTNGYAFYALWARESRRRIPPHDPVRGPESRKEAIRLLLEDLARGHPVYVMPFREALEQGALPYGDVYRGLMKGYWEETFESFRRGLAMPPVVTPTADFPEDWMYKVYNQYIHMRAEDLPFDPPIPPLYEDGEGDGWEWYVIWMDEERSRMEGMDGYIPFFFTLQPEYPMNWWRRRDLSEVKSRSQGIFVTTVEEPVPGLAERVRRVWYGCLPVAQVTYVNEFGETVGPEWVVGVEATRYSHGNFFNAYAAFERPSPDELDRILHPFDPEGILIPSLDFWWAGFLPPSKRDIFSEKVRAKDYEGLPKMPEVYRVPPYTPRPADAPGLPPRPLDWLWELNFDHDPDAWFRDPEFYRAWLGSGEG